MNLKTMRIGNMKYQELVASIESYREYHIAMGELLSIAKEQKIWQTDIGEGIDTWYDFLAQPEIGMGVHEANTLISVFKLSQSIGLADTIQIPPQTLKYMAKVGGDVEDAKVLTTKDFKDKYYEDKHKKDERTYTYLVMKRCTETGNMTKVHGVESEEVLTAFNEKIDE